MSGEFSRTWFKTFLAPETAAPVHREIAFIKHHLPVDEFPRLLDVPCGIGRHAGPLAGYGYDVLGVDRDSEAIKAARRISPAKASFQVLDMRQLDTLSAAAFDGVLCLWQSFGYGDAAENLQVLSAMRRRLRPGGRLVLDVYNADALRDMPLQSVDVRAGREVISSRRWNGPRFGVEIRYSDSPDVDVHDWLVYTPGGLAALGAEAGLEVVCSCAWFDPRTPPAREHQRMQFLFELPGADRT